MSDSGSAKQPSRPRRDPKVTRAYVDRMLSLDPLVNSRQMNDLRWRFIGRKVQQETAAAVDPQEMEQQRQFVIERMEDVRSKFWRADAGKLQAALQQLEVSQFPDLQAGIARLLSTLACRDQIQALRGHPDRETNLYNTIRRVVMLPPQKAGELKEEYLRDLPHSENFWDAKGMADVIGEEFPAVYQLEPTWFDQIGKIKRRRGRQSSDGGGGSFDFDGCSGFGGWGVFILVWIFIKVLMAIMRASNQ